MKKNLLIFTICLLIYSSVYSRTDTIYWSQLMAESEMERHPTRYSSGWDYVPGTVLLGFKGLYAVTGDETYYNYIQNTVDYIVKDNGTISGYDATEYNIDMVKEGSIVLYMYEQTSEDKYKTAAASVRQQLEDHPRTSEGGFWHKQKYPYQMWQDGLYMGQPFYAQYTVLFNEGNELDDVTNQFVLMETHARDTATGLIYHAWDEKKEQLWANSETGCSANFWGRAMGWYMMALVDVLDYIPEDYEKRDSLIHILQRMSEALANYQDEESGCWYQVLDQGTREGNYLESSATCMFAYSFLKAAHNGYIDEKYLEVGHKAFLGILDTFISESNGVYSLNQSCCTAGLSDSRDGSFEYYISEDICSNEGKATGPFIMAALEMEKDTVFTVEVEEQTSIKETIESFNLSVTPNPVTAGAIVSFTLNTDTEVNIRIYNAIGTQIDHLINNYNTGSYSENIDFSENKSGIYFIELQTNEGIETKKVMVR